MHLATSYSEFLPIHRQGRRYALEASLQASCCSYPVGFDRACSSSMFTNPNIASLSRAQYLSWSEQPYMAPVSEAMQRHFDFAVRENTQSPPWKQPYVFKGRLSALTFAWTATFLSFGFRYFRKLGFFLGVVVYDAIMHGFILWDTLLSNSFGRNVKNLRKAGYSDAVTLFFIEINLISASIVASAVVSFIVTDPKIYDIDHICREIMTCPSILAKIAVNLAIAEILFSSVHWILHTYEALIGLHVFHHCSTFSTFSTNLMFHPFDMAIEFGAPFLGLLGMHSFVWKDQLAFLLTFLVFQLWYGYDHDESMQLYHTRHHQRCDSMYAIYTNKKGDPKNNVLKKQMKKLDLQWPVGTSSPSNNS